MAKRHGGFGGSMPSGGMGGMMKQLQKMQEELARMEVTGESGAGLVKVTLNGRHEARAVRIDPSLLTEDKDMLEDLIAAAITDASQRIDRASREKTAALTSGPKESPLPDSSAPVTHASWRVVSLRANALAWLRSCTSRWLVASSDTFASDWLRPATSASRASAGTP